MLQFNQEIPPVRKAAAKRNNLGSLSAMDGMMGHERRIIGSPTLLLLNH
jgi:hypothetical protein